MDYQPLDLSKAQRYESNDGQMKEEDIKDDENMSSCDGFSLVKRKKHISSSSEETTSDRVQEKSRDATVASSRDSSEVHLPDESAMSPSLHPFMPLPFPNYFMNPQNITAYLFAALNASAYNSKLPSPSTSLPPHPLDNNHAASIPRLASEMVNKIPKRSDHNNSSSWKASPLPRTTSSGPAPWIDKSLITPSSSQSSPLGIDLDLHSGAPATDFSHCFRKFSNSAECGSDICKSHNYREHFHCVYCNGRVCVKKEEIIRHIKWHKKRAESLRNGFLRFSSTDDCSEKFPGCEYCRKQTHYHCLKPGCRKIYISTSDVSMHASCHRKDALIMQQGFQRFRGTEDCQSASCSFNGRKTTHFHCIRNNCNYTFKNKADIEKHKTYHNKDEQLNRDGFKKFMKHENCTFQNCRLSRNSNHIHCIRVGCTYVLQSTTQLFPHKKKHERKEQDLAFRKTSLVKEMIGHLGELNNESRLGEGDFQYCNIPGLSPEARKVAALIETLQSANLLTIKLEDLIEPISELIFMKTFKKSNSAEKCFQSECPKLYEEHYHCNKCEHFIPKDNLHNHAKEHLLEEEASKLILETSDDGTACREDCALYQKERHFHCRMYGCNFVIEMNEPYLKRLEHYKLHEEQLIAMASVEPNPSGEPPLAVASPELSPGLPQPVTSTYLTGASLTSIDGFSMLKRKRGRPPKNKPDISRPSPVALLDQASSSPDTIHCRLILPFGPQT